MSAPEAERLRDWLAAHWGCPPGDLDVTITGQSTAGARRRNLMLQIDGGPRPGRFVATVLPTADIAILSMAVDVCRWYDEGVRRSPESIGADYGALAVRLVSRR